jgi:hypothetical protein
MAFAPLAVIPVLTLLFGAWAVASGGLRSLTGILGPAVVAAYPLVILFGWPMHLALLRARCTRWRDYAMAGALLGTIPVLGYVIVAVMFEVKFALSQMGPAALRNVEWGAIGVAVFGVCGVAVALAFRATVFPSQSR